MKRIDFKNLTKEQEEELNKLLTVMIGLTLRNINMISVSPDTVSICTNEGNISLTQMKKEIEDLTLIGIDHLHMYVTTLETIVHERTKKKKKRFWSKFKF